MNLSSLTLLKVLLERSGRKNELAAFLPEMDLEDLEKIEISPLSFDPQDFVFDSLILETHYSWFLPTLKSYSNKEASLFLLSLPGSYVEKIAPLLHIHPGIEKLSKPAKRFFRHILLSSLLGEEKEILPKNYLPPSSLNILSTFSKNRLLQLIDLLALYDLAIEMKKILATTTLKKIEGSLTKAEAKFLKSKRSIKESFTSLPLGLEKWDETKDSLRLMLHKRGLLRLAKALSIQHVHLIWYICHRLDIGRGNLLFRNATKKEEPKIASKIVADIEEILSLINTNQEDGSSITPPIKGEA